MLTWLFRNNLWDSKATENDQRLKSKLVVKKETSGEIGNNSTQGINRPC